MKKINIFLSVVSAMVLLSGCTSAPVENTTNNQLASKKLNIVGCDKVHMLYTDTDAEKDVGGAWTGTDKAIDQKDGVCAYAMVRAKAKPIGDEKYDYLSYVTAEFATPTKADDYYVSKKQKRSGSVDVSGIGSKAFLYKESKGKNYDTLIMLVGNHVVSIECKDVCSDEVYKRIGTTIAERME